MLGYDVILPRLKVHYGMLASLSPPMAETQNFQSRLIQKMDWGKNSFKN